ncbi:antibiotic biosynthesis monooxygenase [Aeromicrobium sp.]
MFTHIAIHTPKPEYRQDVIDSMQRAAAAGMGAPGLVQMAPWKEIEGGRLVGLAIWESREAFLAAAPGIFAVVSDDPFDLWEDEPIVSLKLEEA